MKGIHHRNSGGLAAVLLLSALVLGACSQAQSQSPGAPPPAVTVATATQGEVTDWDEFTGRFEAVQRVELRPRVSGYIEEQRFAEGREVKKGDLLFLIDPRPYRIELERAEADLSRIKSQLALAQSESARADRLLNSRAISQEEHDQRSSQQSQSQAQLRSAQAAVDSAKLNLEYTRVLAPIDGRVSRALVTAGNYVTAGDTVLTSLVSLDPIYVSFDGDEQSYLKHQAQPQSGSPVYVGLSDESGYPHEGRMNFLDNALDPATGTIHARALLSNPDRRFTPGLLARIRLPSGDRYAATLIPDSAVATDQDRRYVLVVKGDDTVEYRPVELGGTHDNLRVVRQGLAPQERVVTSGLQRARPGAKVTPQPAPVVAGGGDSAVRLER